MQNQKWIMVTGASSGVGRSCVLLLSDRGYNIIACVRKESDGKMLQRHNLNSIYPVICELQDQETIEQAAHTAAELTAGKGIDGLVNCAGILYCGPLEYFSRSNWFEQYDVNLFGTMALTRTMLPLIRKANGRIVTISGVGGGVALPFYGAIASSKIALEAANDCLRRELYPWGIHVILIEPGGIDTPANDKMRDSVREYLDTLEPQGRERYAHSMETFSYWADRMHKRNLKPEQVAKTILKALTAKKPRTRYKRGLDSYGVALLSKVLPDRLFDMAIRMISSLPLRFGAWRDKS